MDPVRKVHPETLAEIYKLMRQQKPPSLDELQKRYSVDTSAYQGKIMVRLFYIFEEGGVFVSNEVLPVSKFRDLDWEEKLELGSVNGPNTAVRLSLNEMVVDIFEDPFKIYTFVETHGDLVVEGCGYLDKVLREKEKVTAKQDEEGSEEESGSDSNTSSSGSESDSNTSSESDSGSEAESD